jgi:YbbR domain-containing protein
VRALLRNAFVENAALKAVAMILAVTLFILVRGDKDTQREVRVGVAYIKPTDRELVSQVPQAISVWVRGPWTRIKRLDPHDVDPIVVDLSRQPDGSFTIQEDMIRLPAGLRVASIKPSSIAVAFEHEKIVPIVPEPSGAPAEGFFVRDVVAEPATVTIKGARADLDPIVDLRTLPISLAGKRDAFSEDVKLAALPNGVTADQDTVKLTVHVVEENAKLTLSIPVEIRGGSGLELAPRAVELVLRGQRHDVDLVDATKLVAWVDAHDSSAKLLPVEIEGLPPGVTHEVRPDRVTVVPKPGK